jgi:hypothetical protein
MRQLAPPTLIDLIQYITARIDKEVGVRTIQQDLQEMRYSQSLRFEAPIIFDRRTLTYRYSRVDYSIHTLPVTAEDLHGLEFAISILEQFKELPAIRIIRRAGGKGRLFSSIDREAIRGYIISILLYVLLRSKGGYLFAIRDLTILLLRHIL